MDSDPSLLTRLFGYAMIAVGALMALLSGACTLLFLTTYRQMIWVPLAIGGPFIAIGIALVAGGRSMSRRRTPSVAPDDVS